MVHRDLVDLAERTWSTAKLLAADPADAGAIDDLDKIRGEYVELYETAAAVALDETTFQVAAARKKWQARLAAKDERIERLRAEVAELRKQVDGTDGRRRFRR